MGYIAHDAVIVTASDYPWTYPRDGIKAPDVDAFRAEMPEELRHLMVGPIESVANGYRTYLFAPDGSKEGWDTSTLVDEWRERFIELFSEGYEDGSSPFDVVHIRYGGDSGGEVGTMVCHTTDAR